MSKKGPKDFSNKGYRDEEIISLSFDTETDGLGGELLFVTACSLDETHEFEGENMIGQLVDLMVEHPYPYVWYAHNAQYDWRYFMDFIRDNQIMCEINMRTETDIYQITMFIDGVRVVMRDSLAVFPGTLKQFAQSFTPELPKGDLDFETETFDPTNERHRAYARRDAQILRYGIPRFNSMMTQHFGVTLGHTTAGTAIKAWQQTLKDGEFYACSKDNERERFIRAGYFGGLSFLTTTEHFNSTVGEIPAARTFDINSSYPNVMCKYGVPGGAVCESDDWADGRLGIYRVRVSTPSELVIPILPHRNERGNMRWSRGEFETIVTSSELIFAAEHGYQILDVYEGLVWEKQIFPFDIFIDRCKTIRREYKGQPEEILAKLMQNSSYGKYGSRRERMRVFIPRSQDEIREGDIPIDELEYFWSRKENSDTLRCKPEWAVFITAHARLELLSQAYRIGVQNVICGDTDSLTVRGEFADAFNIGNEYGQWKIEKEWQQFRAIAPKVYSGQLLNGKWMGAAKGMPRKIMTQQLWEQLANEGQIVSTFDSLPSLRVAMKRGAQPAKTVSRISTDLNNSANWELQNTSVRPKIAA